jgi:hypothetical protein
MMPVAHMHISLLEDILITTCRQALAVALLSLQVTQADLATAAAHTHKVAILQTVQQEGRRCKLEEQGMLIVEQQIHTRQDC